MSRRNKLEKFAELLGFPNVYENFDVHQPELTGLNGKTVDLKGKWASEHFKNDRPIVLELACGRGEYSLGLARLFPEKNFIGVDIKGARIWKGAKIALEEKLNNVAFLRTRIEQITHFFDKDEISEIWITFPDPFLRKSKANRRLTSPSFIQRYRQILQPEGIVHLKTDSPELYEFTVEVINDDQQIRLINQNVNIYAGELPLKELAIQTYYERMHLADRRTIKYLSFTI